MNAILRPTGPFLTGTRRTQPRECRGGSQRGFGRSSSQRERPVADHGILTTVSVGLAAQVEELDVELTLGGGEKQAP